MKRPSRGGGGRATALSVFIVPVPVTLIDGLRGMQWLADAHASARKMVRWLLSAVSKISNAAQRQFHRHRQSQGDGGPTMHTPAESGTCDMILLS